MRENRTYGSEGAGPGQPGLATSIELEEAGGWKSGWVKPKASEGVTGTRRVQRPSRRRKEDSGGPGERDGRRPTSHTVPAGPRSGDRPATLRKQRHGGHEARVAQVEGEGRVDEPAGEGESAAEGAVAGSGPFC